jgi:tmRNA-binding protein
MGISDWLDYNLAHRAGDEVKTRLTVEEFEEKRIKAISSHTYNLEGNFCDIKDKDLFLIDLEYPEYCEEFEKIGDNLFESAIKWYF